MPIAQRDERALWEQFRTACDAVFDARQAKRKEEDSKKSEHRRALDEVVAALDAAARAGDEPEQNLKRALRDAQDQWKKLSATFDPAVREVEGRFKESETEYLGTPTSREVALFSSRSRQRSPARTLRPRTVR